MALTRDFKETVLEQIHTTTPRVPRTSNLGLLSYLVGNFLSARN